MRFVAETIDELLMAAAASATRSVGSRELGVDEADEQLVDFLRMYYAQVNAEDLLDHRPEDLAGAALTHRRLAEQRHVARGSGDDEPGREPAVRAFTPNVESDGWSIGHTVIQVVTDDMPFVVDSIAGCVSAMGRRVLRIVHPVLTVDRSSAQLRVLNGKDGGTRESWVHMEIPRETDPADLADLTDAVRAALADVAATVIDYDLMRRQALAAATRLRSDVGALPEDDAAEAADLLEWLADYHFTFIGYREHALESVHGSQSLVTLPETGLGILRPSRRPRQHATSPGGAETSGDPIPELEELRSTTPGKRLTGSAQAKAHERTALIVTKSNARSTVHRDAYLDYVGVRVFDENGQVTGEQRFLGLFTSVAYHESVTRIPVLRRKVAAVHEASGFEPASHASNSLQRVLETFPRDELFQVSEEQLTEIATDLVGVQNQRRVRLFVRPDDFGRYLSCLVYVPQDQYDTRVRLRLQQILTRATGGASIDYAASVGESEMARLHVVIRMPRGHQLPDLDLGLLQHELTRAVRSWDDDLADALTEQFGEELAATLFRRYGRAFSQGYRESFGARVAAADIQRLEELPSGGLTCLLYQVPGAPSHHRRLKLYRDGGSMSLTEVLPLLHHLGVTVTDEVPYDVVRSDASHAHIYDFGLRYAWSSDPQDRERFQTAFEAVWNGDVDTDGLNALVLAAGLDHGTISMLRGYVRYLRQAGASYSSEYLHEAMVENPTVVRLLVELFHCRLDPSAPAGEQGTRSARVEEVEARLAVELDSVPSLDHDRMLQSIHRAINATLRTNYFQRRDDGRPPSALAFKICSRELPELPEPRPWAEIWVSSPVVEGVHLRLGPVARGGLRWSDRREDFRVEVLDLVKAQAVKNSAIVPVGAKGGFVVKHTSDPDRGRQGALDDGLVAYRTFIAAMLDVTDSLEPGSGREPVPPPDVVCWDDPDPYLVVAADKGTATFSDVANGIALERNFWLGDAFASGGSAGYDHKAMGITARGAWESVKRHFHDLGRDCQRDPFTCVGIGDMSGDVFGNAMLLSEATRLVAAFDHRHIFLDPDPDPMTSFAERKRLFEASRSSWADYDAALISEGGGVWARRQKRIPVSPQVRSVLGLGHEVTALPPDELIRAILTAPVDLLFNGGVGTFVKASTERHEDAADKTNDRTRVDGSQLRCAVVGEGGNLGLTQRARVEFARGGGHINTDAIDNSAGVNTSDHEVNIKILVDAAVRGGDLASHQRDELLASMTDEVARLVLRHNYRQNVALAMGLAQAADFVHVHDDYLSVLSARGVLDRQLEGLPTRREMRERRMEGHGLSNPELAVVSAYAKNSLSEELVASDLPDLPALQRLVLEYFPVPLRERFAAGIQAHPLRREIISTRLANNVVDVAGTTFIHRVTMETGATPVQLCGAHLVASKVFDADTTFREIGELDHRVDAETQTTMRLVVRTLVERAARWFVVDGAWRTALDAGTETYTVAAQDLLQQLPSLLAEPARRRFEEQVESLRDASVPEALAIRIAGFPVAHAALGIAATARNTGASPADVARIHFAIAERIGLGELQARVGALPRQDRWQTMARATLRDDLYRLHAELTSAVVRQSLPGVAPGRRVPAWEAEHADVVTAAETLVQEVLEEDQVDLARASVGLRAVKDLLRRATVAEQ